MVIRPTYAIKGYIVFILCNAKESSEGDALVDGVMCGRGAGGTLKAKALPAFENLRNIKKIHLM